MKCYSTTNICRTVCIPTTIYPITIYILSRTPNFFFLITHLKQNNHDSSFTDSRSVLRLQNSDVRLQHFNTHLILLFSKIGSNLCFCFNLNCFCLRIIQWMNGNIFYSCEECSLDYRIFFIYLIIISYSCYRIMLTSGSWKIIIAWTTKLQRYRG